MVRLGIRAHHLDKNLLAGPSFCQLHRLLREKIAEYSHIQRFVTLSRWIVKTI